VPPPQLNHQLVLARARAAAIGADLSGAADALARARGALDEFRRGVFERLGGAGTGNGPNGGQGAPSISNGGQDAPSTSYAPPLGREQSSGYTPPPGAPPEGVDSRNPPPAYPGKCCLRAPLVGKSLWLMVNCLQRRNSPRHRPSATRRLPRRPRYQQAAAMRRPQVRPRKASTAVTRRHHTPVYIYISSLVYRPPWLMLIIGSYATAPATAHQLRVATAAAGASFDKQLCAAPRRASRGSRRPGPAASVS
jgi:hypothetical protein